MVREVVVQRRSIEQCTVSVPEDASEQDIMAEAKRSNDWFVFDSEKYQVLEDFGNCLARRKL